jgi:prepilin-type N-terminal cleavage/methylation domain-containing protein
MKKAFTLIELLVVISVIALLLAILLPVMGRARLGAKVAVVNAELRQIAMALDMYMEDNDGNVPPTRANCMMQENFFQLPEELVKGRYLPTPDEEWQGAGMADRFNKDFSYKYVSPGELIVNLNTVMQNKLWVPDGFPDRDSVEEGKYYRGIRSSPVTWVVYSVGPQFDEFAMRRLHYPVPRRTWYDPKERSGVIVRMRLREGRHIGSFEWDSKECQIDADETGS